MIGGEGFLSPATETSMIVLSTQRNPLSMCKRLALKFDACLPCAPPMIDLAAILGIAMTTILMLGYTHLAIFRISPALVMTLAFPFSVNGIELALPALLQNATTVFGVGMVAGALLLSQLIALFYTAQPIIFDLLRFPLRIAISVRFSACATPALQAIRLSAVSTKGGARQDLPTFGAHFRGIIGVHRNDLSGVVPRAAANRAGALLYLHYSTNGRIQQ